MILGGVEVGQGLKRSRECKEVFLRCICLFFCGVCAKFSGMYSLFLPVVGEEVYVVVASSTGVTTASGEYGFAASAVSGEVVGVKRDTNPTRGFKVKVKLVEKSSSAPKTEVLVNVAAVVRPEYVSELGEGEIKALIAGGHVPIVSEKRTWKKAKDKGSVNVKPWADAPQKEPDHPAAPAPAPPPPVEPQAKKSEVMPCRPLQHVQQR